jgi:hypothetical protein
MAARLILMCGLPGAGKTTRARELEAERRALRLTPDEWITALLGADPAPERLDAYRAPIEALLWGVAARALALSVDVILDFGFWSRAERDAYRTQAARLGAATEVVYVAATPAELRARLARRAAARPPEVFVVSEAQLDAWLAVFEAPTADELDELRRPTDDARPSGAAAPSP